MTICIYRITYDGICEIWVESDGRHITKVLAATPGSALIGRALDALPDASCVEVKLMSQESA